jgi:hypothetical protein
VNVGTNSNSYTVPSPSVSFRTYRVVITGAWYGNRTPVF